MHFVHNVDSIHKRRQHVYAFLVGTASVCSGARRGNEILDGVTDLTVLVSALLSQGYVPGYVMKSEATTLISFWVSVLDMKLPDADKCEITGTNFYIR